MDNKSKVEKACSFFVFRSGQYDDWKIKEVKDNMFDVDLATDFEVDEYCVQFEPDGPLAKVSCDEAWVEVVARPRDIAVAILGMSSL